MGLNDLLYDPIRHNNWATGSLIEFCRAQNLTAEQLEITGLGIEPPDIQAWEYAWTTNRIWDLDEASV